MKQKPRFFTPPPPALLLALAASLLWAMPAFAEGPTDTPDGDLSRYLLSVIFGDGWDSIGGTLSATTFSPLVYDLLRVLNSCCAVAIAWMFILTTLCATLGAAQDGNGVGGRRYSNAWIPLRYTFAMGAVTPVFAGGMCAMQVMILSCIGLSIGFANHMWITAINKISVAGLAVSDKTLKADASQSAKRVVPALVEHAALHMFLKRDKNCSKWQGMSGGGEGSEGSATFKPGKGDLAIGPALDGGHWVTALYLPHPTQCGKYVQTNPKIKKGDMGMITISTLSKEANQAVLDAIISLYSHIYSTLYANMQNSENWSAQTMQFDQFIAEYKTGVEGALLAHKDKLGTVHEQISSELRATAARNGWFTAGSYYWTIARLSNDAIEALADHTTSRRVNSSALYNLGDDVDTTRAITTASEMYQAAQSAAGEIDYRVEAGGAAAQKIPVETAEMQKEMRNIERSSSLIAVLRSVFGFIPHALDGWRPAGDNLVKSAIDFIGQDDMVIKLVRSARFCMNIAEEAVLTYVQWSTMGGFAEGILSNFPLVGAGVKALNNVFSTLGVFVLAIAIPLWCTCWFYAYMLPMIPFIAWFTAIIGWVILTLEAIIAAPVWLIGHCMPDGDGFAGAQARAGYALFMSTLLRPLLLVISMFVCLIIMSVSGLLVGWLIMPFLDSVSSTFGTVGVFGTSMSITTTISSIFLLGTIISIATWKLFTLVTTMPDRIIRWAGQLFQQLGDDRAEHNVSDATRKMTETSNNLTRVSGFGMIGASAAQAGSKTGRLFSGKRGNPSLEQASQAKQHHPQ